MSDKKWITRFDEKNQVFHDIFIFPESDIAVPNETHLQMSDGIVIIDQNDIGKHLIETLKTIAKEPLPITADEIQARTIWYQKMLSRAEVGDLEGKYRHIWSIFTILEDYFAFKKLRYHGPKKAFQYLTKHDPDILNLFEHALFAAICGYVKLQHMRATDVIKNCYQLQRNLFNEVIAAFISTFLPSMEHMNPQFLSAVNA